MNERIVPVVQSTGEHEENIMLFGKDDGGNLGSRMWERILAALRGVEGLDEKQAMQLAEVAAKAGITAVADTFDGQLVLRIDLHTRNGSNQDRPVQTFVVQRVDRDTANKILGGEE